MNNLYSFKTGKEVVVPAGAYMFGGTPLFYVKRPNWIRRALFSLLLDVRWYDIDKEKYLQVAGKEGWL